MDNKKTTGEKIACFHTAFCPAFILGVYFYYLSGAMSGGGNSDTAGWATLFFLFVGVIIVPVGLVDLLPFILTLVAIKKKKYVMATVSMIISDVVFVIVLICAEALKINYHVGTVGLVILGIAYIMVSAYAIVKLNAPKESA